MYVDCMQLYWVQCLEVTDNYGCGSVALLKL